MTFPAGYQCQFEEPSRTGRDPSAPVRVIAHDPGNLMCFVAVFVIPEPDLSTEGGVQLDLLIEGLLQGSQWQADGAYLKHESGAEFRTLVGGPSTLSAVANIGRGCDSAVLLGMLMSVATFTAPASPSSLR